MHNPPVSPVILGLFDSVGLTVSLIPMLYLFVYKPMINYSEEQRRLEKEIARVDQLSMLGNIAANLAHEIRNPMTAVRGFLQLFSQKSELKEFAGHIELMIGEVDRVNSLISEFLLLARKKPLSLNAVDLNEIVRTISPLISADAAVRHQMAVIRLETVPELELDQNEIRQLLLNLCRNGLEAMTAGGTLTISTSYTGNNVVMTVKDEGCGIDTTVLDKIGTPFFTTKPDGTGLGISVCHSIVERHNASMNIKSKPGDTQVQIFFPLPNKKESSPIATAVDNHL